MLFGGLAASLENSTGDYVCNSLLSNVALPVSIGTATGGGCYPIDRAYVRARVCVQTAMH